MLCGNNDRTSTGNASTRGVPRNTMMHKSNIVHGFYAVHYQVGNYKRGSINEKLLTHKVARFRKVSSLVNEHSLSIVREQPSL